MELGEDSFSNVDYVPHVSEEKLSGIVQTITFHSEDSGYSVLKVSPLFNSKEIVTVILYQCKVFAGATMDFFGQWKVHSKFGDQFKATRAIELRPADVSALEKYLGSGLIFGVGPKTAKRIVKCFGDKTLDVFEKDIHRLMEVDGIAKKKLISIKDAWEEHREIRNVMMFLQSYGLSTLFAVKIYKQYGPKSIEIVKENPYKLSKDIYGIGFFSADKIALKLGFENDSVKRIEAAIHHVLDASREVGHCFLLRHQIAENVQELLHFDEDQKILKTLDDLNENKVLKVRKGLHRYEGETLYYSSSLFFDEFFLVKKIQQIVKQNIEVDDGRVANWLERYSSKEEIRLSDEQLNSISQIIKYPLSILTGGPGCGKTTTTKTLVKLLLAMKKRILLAAPTGRAAQRMMEVIGLESKTIHRVLLWNPKEGKFRKNEEDPLDADFLIVDECSMLDITLSASLFKAINVQSTQVLLIGDVDQLPSVGPGNVLRDIINSGVIPVFKLTQVFRQALESSIIRYAHQINQGEVPKIESPFQDPTLWKTADCVFIDSEEIGVEQAQILRKIKNYLNQIKGTDEGLVERKVAKDKVGVERIWLEDDDLYSQKLKPDEIVSMNHGKNLSVFQIPDKFRHIDLMKVHRSESLVDDLKNVVKKIHPWSSLNYGFTALEMLKKIYAETINKNLGNQEIQILCPMTRGTLGTININKIIQELINPKRETIKEFKIGEKILRENDRVIQKRNNYDLGVFNGDIGKISSININESVLEVEFKQNFEIKKVIYKLENINELDLAYALTIHKSQGSEFSVVIIPVFSQHFKMLFRNLIYTGLTRAKKLAVFIGQRKALSLSIFNIDVRERQTLLQELLKIHLK